MQHIPTKIDENLKKQLAKLSVDELLALEDAIASLLQGKRTKETGANWQEDFLSISTWTHLDESTLPKLDKWTIETF